MAEPSRPLNAKQIERLNSSGTKTAIKWMSRAQTWLFKTSNGKLGNKFLKGSEVGILTTIGRKSGEPRDSPLLFLQEGQRIVLVASQGGSATNPMWYLNLVANPRITFRTMKFFAFFKFTDFTPQWLFQKSIRAPACPAWTATKWPGGSVRTTAAARRR